MNSYQIVETIVFLAYSYWVFRKLRYVERTLSTILQWDKKILAMAKTQDNIVIVLRETALREAIIMGVATKNSPLIITPEVREMYAGFIGEIKEFYSKTGRHLSKEDCWLEIAVRWKDVLTQQVCLPLKLVSPTCVEIAMELAKEGVE